MIKRVFQKAAFFLSVAAVLAAQLHIGHADASHLQSGDHKCAVCKTISSSDVPLGPAIRPVHETQERVVDAAHAVARAIPFLTASPRAPPAI